VIPTRHILIASLICAFAGAARADATCVPDAKRFCAGKPATELLSCLQAHRPDLAPACVQRVEKVLVAFQSAVSDCEPDAYEFCRGVGPGKPMVDCLRAREGKLTKRCQDFFDAIRARDEALRRACAKEASRVCPTASPARGELWMCLWLNGEDLSPECQQAL
jgi:hypothetical protein